MCFNTGETVAQMGYLHHCPFWGGGLVECSQLLLEVELISLIAFELDLIADVP